MKNLFGFVFFLCYLVSFTSSFGNLPMGSNSSTPKLQTRQPQIALYGGTNINIIRPNPTPLNKGKTCTLGFAVKRVKGQGHFKHGYLTAGSCTHGRSSGIFTAFVAYGVNEKRVKLTVGKGATSWGGYDPKGGRDYAIIKVDPEYWDPRFSAGVIINNVITPVVDRMFPGVGSQVCFSSVYSGYVCGEIKSFNIPLSIPSPWQNLQGQYPEEFFQNMVLVKMAQTTKAQNDNVKSIDFGSPVFVPIPDPANPKQMRGVAPVGILGGYVALIQPVFGVPLGLDERYFYYTPIERILNSIPNLQLILLSPKM